MQRSPFCGHRFPPDIIRHAVWLYLRFTLSFRDLLVTLDCCAASAFGEPCVLGRPFIILKLFAKHVIARGYWWYRWYPQGKSSNEAIPDRGTDARGGTTPDPGTTQRYRPDEPDSLGGTTGSPCTTQENTALRKRRTILQRHSGGAPGGLPWIDLVRPPPRPCRIDTRRQG